MIKINTRTQQAIIESLKAGVVPKIGLQFIQVGRDIEIKEMIKDLDLIKDKGSKTRFIIGEYGSGKSFFLNLAKNIALEHNCVVLNADITTEKTFVSSDGKALALFSELMKNASTKSKPDGNALSTIVERWIQNVMKQDSISEQDILKNLKSLEQYNHCYDFCKVLSQYLYGYNSDNEILMMNALRWIRGEYTTKIEARNDLGVRTIIEDTTYYDFIKLFAGFVQLSGYSGLVVCIDELAVLNRLRSQSRNKNFEQILHIINDSLQGSSLGLGFIFSGTPEFLTDTYKGLYSYEALRTRLKENPFSTKDQRDVTGIVIRLNTLSPEELYLLCQNIRKIFAKGQNGEEIISDSQIQHFLQWIYSKLGAESYLKPREAIKNFVGLVSQLISYPNTPIENYLGNLQVEKDIDPELLNTDSELVDLRL